MVGARPYQIDLFKRVCGIREESGREAAREHLIRLDEQFAETFKIQKANRESIGFKQRDRGYMFYEDKHRGEQG